MVASCHQAGTCRRTERSGVHVGVGQACLCQAVHGGGLDESTPPLHRGKAHVVPHDKKDVGCTFWRFGLLVRLPVRLGVADIQVDDTLKWFGHGTFSFNSCTRLNYDSRIQNTKLWFCDDAYRRHAVAGESCAHIPCGFVSLAKYAKFLHLHVKYTHTRTKTHPLNALFLHMP